MSDLINRQDAIAIATQEGAYGYISAQELAEMPSAQRWIPCSERLPEEARSYLVTNSKWGAWCVDRDMFIDGHWAKNDDVIAWMPLPEPYEERRTE